MALRLEQTSLLYCGPAGRQGLHRRSNEQSSQCSVPQCGRLLEPYIDKHQSLMCKQLIYLQPKYLKTCACSVIAVAAVAECGTDRCQFEP